MPRWEPKLIQKALAAVQKAPVKHADETGWKKAGHKRWLWVVATTNVVVFLIHRLRITRRLVMQLLGETLQGILFQRPLESL